MPDLGPILSGLSATKVCILILARPSVVLKTCSKVWNLYVFLQGTRLGFHGENNLSCIGHVFGVGYNVDLRYRGTYLKKRKRVSAS